MDAFIGEIRAFAFGWLPEGWLACDGMQYNIQPQFVALFSVIGSTFGGDGKTTFKVPDLRGQTVVDQLPGDQHFAYGVSSGTVQETVNFYEMPSHNHSVEAASGTTRQNAPTNSASFFNPQFKSSTLTASYPIYETTNAGSAVMMAPQAIGATGGNQPHENRQPYVAMTFGICAIGGEYPVRP